MALFRHRTGHAVYESFYGLDPLPKSTPFDVAVLAMARVKAKIASVTELPVEKAFRGGRRQKNNPRFCKVSLHGHKPVEVTVLRLEMESEKSEESCKGE